MPTMFYRKSPVYSWADWKCGSKNKNKPNQNSPKLAPKFLDKWSSLAKFPGFLSAEEAVFPYVYFHSARAEGLEIFPRREEKVFPSSLRPLDSYALSLLMGMNQHNAQQP